jgi:hypothetical protein
MKHLLSIASTLVLGSALALGACSKEKKADPVKADPPAAAPAATAPAAAAPAATTPPAAAPATGEAKPEDKPKEEAKGGW